MQVVQSALKEPEQLPYFILSPWKLLHDYSITTLTKQPVPSSSLWVARFYLNHKHIPMIQQLNTETSVDLLYCNIMLL